MSNNIDLFFNTILEFGNSYHKTQKGMEQRISQLNGWKKTFLENIQSRPIMEKITEEHGLYQPMENLNKQIDLLLENWEITQKKFDEISKFSEELKDQLILFVCGKVNSGKSTLCNFFIEQAQKKNIESAFCEFSKGKQKSIEIKKLKVGATEKTSTIQGVKIGSLFMIDSPGRGSVTEENGKLTKDFIDIADAVLWLTSSGSPGQVEELEDIAKEIRKKKPFIPVITKSDKIEFDEDENGKIINSFLLKTPEIRKAQEKDVKKRTKDKVKELNGDQEKVKEPVSISIKYIKKQNDRDRILEESGVDRLFKELCSIINDAAEYKLKKPVAQMKNYLENILLKSINKELTSIIKELEQTYQKEIATLEHMKKVHIPMIKNIILLKLDKLIETHKNQKNINGFAEDFKNLIIKTVHEEIIKSLEKFFRSTARIVVSITPDKLEKYEDKTIEIRQKRGAWKKKAWGSGGLISGMIGGGIAGTAFAGPLGTIAGGIIGAISGGTAGETIGEKIGEQFVEYYTITEKIGISGEKISNSSIKLLDNTLPQIIDQITSTAIKDLKPLKNHIDFIKREINSLEKKINSINLEDIQNELG